MTTVHPTDTPADIPATTSAPPIEVGGPPRFRRLVGAACLPLLALALLSTGPLDPFDDSARASVQLGQLSAHVREVQVLGYVELLAALLFAGVVLAFAGHTRGRGRGVGNAGVVFGVLGVCGMALVAVHHWLLIAVSTVPTHEATRVLDKLDTVAGPAILPMMLSAPVALLLFAIAGRRAGFVPLPALLLTIAFFVGELVPGLPGGELVPLLLLLVAMAWIATELVRRTDVPGPER